jgi:hypothetical protein
MVFQIPLLQQQETPPERAGIAKPEFSAADRSGEIEFGRTLAKFGGEIYEQNVKARSINEQHEFLGTVNTAQQEWEGFIKNNPGTDFNKLQQARDKMMTTIGNAGQKATTSIAKNWITNWYDENKNALYAKTQATMDGIVSRQEFERFKISEKLLIEAGDKAGLEDLYDKMSGIKSPAFNAEALEKIIPGGEITRPETGRLPTEQISEQAPGAPIVAGGQEMLSAEGAALRKEAAFAAIDANNAKTVLDGQITTIVAAKGWDEAYKWISDEKNVRKLFKEFGIGLKDINEVTNITKARMKENQAEEAETLKNLREKDSQAILDRIFKGDFTSDEVTGKPDINAQINTSSLTTEEKRSWSDYAKSVQDAAIKGETIKTNKMTQFNITEAIREYKLGERTFKSAEKMLKDNIKELDTTTLNSLQTKLYTAEKDVLNRKIDSTLERRIKLGSDHMKQVFTESGLLGEDQEFEGVQFFGNRLEEWERFWELNPQATEEQSLAFMNLLTEDVWTRGRNRFLDVRPLAKVNERINAELAKLGFTQQQKQFELDKIDNDPNDISLQDLTDEELLKRITGNSK